MSQNPHPARSPEFLSRLHDSELSPAERAHFESHRAHCAECRNAAAEFEAALSLFRSTGPRPAAPDLSARILRKLQQTQRSSRRRLHFGPTFGIDLRWAGAFAAAVIAAIVGSSVVVRNEARQSVLLKAPASLEESSKSDAAPSAATAPKTLAVGDETSAASARDRLSGKLSSTDAARGEPRQDAPLNGAGEKAGGDLGYAYDKDGKVAAPASQPAETLAKQKEIGKLNARAPEVIPPGASQSPRGAERDLREEAASGFAERGQTKPQPQTESSASNAVEGRAQNVQDSRTSQVSQEAERKRPARQQNAKAEIARDAAENQNASPQNSPQNRNAANYSQPQAPAAAPPPAAAAPRDGERAGGEGGAAALNSNVNFQDGASVANVRLVVAPLDDGGAAPDVVPLTAGDVPAAMKGQEFVVIVDMAGRVQQVSPRHPPPPESRSQKEKRLKKATPPPSPLASLRFQPGARQRRLLVRVE